MGFFLVWAGLFLLTPILVGLLSVIGMIADRGRFLGYGFLFAASVGLLFSQFTPGPDLDLYRYWLLMDRMSSSEPAEALSSLASSTDPLSYLAIFLVSSAWGNLAIASSVSFILYMMYFAIIDDAVRRNSISTGVLTFVVLYFLCAFHLLNSVSGVRFGLAVAVFASGAYLWGFRHSNRIGILLIVTASLFHTSLALIGIIFVGAIVLRRLAVWMQIVMVATLAGSARFLINLAESISNLAMFGSAAAGAEYYLDGYRPEGIWFIFQVFSGVLFLSGYFIAERDAADNRERVLWRFGLMVTFIGLVNAGNFHIATRMFTVSRNLFFLVLALLLSRSSVSAWKKVILILIGGIIGAGTLVNQFAALSSAGILDILKENLLEPYLFVD